MQGLEVGPGRRASSASSKATCSLAIARRERVERANVEARGERGTKRGIGNETKARLGISGTVEI